MSKKPVDNVCDICGIDLEGDHHTLCEDCEYETCSDEWVDEDYEEEE